MNNDKSKTRTLNAQFNFEKFPHETHDTKNKTRQKNECQNQCFCNQQYIWDSDEKNITDLGSLKICSHCKKKHKFCLNYKSESSFSSWADMMEKDLKWNKQQNLDDENQKTIHNIKKKKKKTDTPCDNGLLFLECRRGKNGYR